MCIPTLRISGLQIRDLPTNELSANKVYYFPQIYLTLSELEKKTRSIALNALSHAPKLIENELTPIEIRNDKEMIKTALISSYTKDSDLYFRLLFLNPDLNLFAAELEEAFDSLNVQDGSELCRIQSFYNCLFRKLSPVLQRILFETEAPEEIRNHPQLAFHLVCRNPYLFTFMSPRCRETKSIVRVAILKLPQIFSSLTPILQADPKMRHAKVHSESLLLAHQQRLRTNHEPITNMVCGYPPDESEVT